MSKKNTQPKIIMRAATDEPFTTAEQGMHSTIQVPVLSEVGALTHGRKTVMSEHPTGVLGPCPFQ